MGHNRKLANPLGVTHVNTRAAVGVCAQELILAQAEARLRRDAIYARIAMNYADREPRRRTEPRVGSKAQRASERAGVKVHFGYQLDGDLVGCEHECLRVSTCGRGRDAHQQNWPAHLRTLSLLVVAACHYDVGQADRAFYNWDERKVHCAIDIDSYARISTASIETGLDRAQERGEVLELYTHNPGTTITWDAVEAVLAGAQARGLAYVTYADMVEGKRPSGGGLALSFDDLYLNSWLAGRDLFKRYDARLTFFIAHWTASARDGIRSLAADGHDIEAHSVNHLRGPVVVEERGLEAYISEEVVPSIQVLRDEGYGAQVFAYPYGARTNETDRAILEHVSLLRSVTFTWDSPAIDPCPD